MMLQLTDRCEVRADGPSLLLLTNVFRNTFRLLALHVTVFIAVVICNGQSVDLHSSILREIGSLACINARRNFIVSLYTALLLFSTIIQSIFKVLPLSYIIAVSSQLNISCCFGHDLAATVAPSTASPTASAAGESCTNHVALML